MHEPLNEPWMTPLMTFRVTPHIEVNQEANILLHNKFKGPINPSITLWRSFKR